MKKKLILSMLLFCACLFFVWTPVHADNLDEIQKYQITVEPNQDATLNMTYHIEWEVLDSDSEGPLSWVKIGLPNSHCENLKALTSTVSSIKFDSDDGYYALVYFDREYEEGEVVKFEFSLTQDYLYQMNQVEEGYTQYTFTPGWFDEIEVDSLEIRWKNDNIHSFSPDCKMDGGYDIWTTSLIEGETFTVKVSYPNDALGFIQSVSDAYSSENNSYSSDDYDASFWEDDDDDGSFEGICFVLGFFIFFGIPAIVSYLSNNAYDAGANFGTGGSTKKITRTKVTYYESCPNCGGTRAEGKDICAYCGTNMVKSEEILSEEELKAEEKDQVLKYKKDGLYAYASHPNVFIRVHSVPVPHPRRGGHRPHSGSCAHSSCAHSSCACACACACAGGGRAGCSAKDFYSVKVKRMVHHK